MRRWDILKFLFFLQFGREPKEFSLFIQIFNSSIFLNPWIGVFVVLIIWNLLLSISIAYLWGYPPHHFPLASYILKAKVPSKFKICVEFDPWSNFTLMIFCHLWGVWVMMLISPFCGEFRLWGMLEFFVVSVLINLGVFVFFSLDSCIGSFSKSFLVRSS